MSGVAKGARLFRTIHGKPRDDERDDLATDTGVQRGRLIKRATQGDKDARAALDAWQRTQETTDADA